MDFRELKSQKFSGETCPQTLAPRWGDRSVFILDTRLILYTRFNIFNKASSTRIRFCLKMKTFPPVWLPVHTYSPKTVGENASFQKRSPEWRFLKCLFAVLMWMNYCKVEVFENDYLAVWDTSKCTGFHQRWHCFKSPLPFCVDG